MDELQERAALEKAILKDFPRMSEEDAFPFSCDRGAPCFTRCCADVNIALTPYDVLRLKKRLGITSGEFLDRHAIIPFTPAQALPVPLLKMRDDEGKRCPFVEGGGCRVYEDRPWACRMYPIGVASPKDDLKERKFYFLMKEAPCEGHGRGRTWTVRSWMENQGVAPYDDMGEAFKEVTLHDFFQRGGRLDPAKIDMFFMACYDLDKFRRFVFDSSFLRKMAVDEAAAAEAKADDAALLKLGFRWLRYCLFGESAMDVRPDVKEILRKQLGADAAGRGAPKNGPGGGGGR